MNMTNREAFTCVQEIPSHVIYPAWADNLFAQSFLNGVIFGRAQPEEVAEPEPVMITPDFAEPDGDQSTNTDHNQQHEGHADGTDAASDDAEKDTGMPSDSAGAGAQETGEGRGG